MIKIVCLMNRKAGMSLEAFKTYYEERHVPLINRLLPYWSDYRRNFAAEVQDYEPGHLAEDRPHDRPFDVMTEISFESEDMYRKMTAALSDPEIGKIVAEDEAKFFDRSSMRTYIVEERRSIR